MRELIFSLAPMEGITGYVYRNALKRCYGGVARFYSPFISPGHAGAGITKRDRRDILPENNAGVPLIPQLLTNNAEDFLYAADILRDYGYKELNLNLGCPSGTVTAKKKGAGFLTELPALRHFFEEVFRNLPADTKLGVKTRLGVKAPAEFPAIIEIYNDFPLSELIVHPRIQKEFYRGTVHLDMFSLAAEGAKMPLGYNGDLIDEEDIDRILERFPAVSHIMLGRGLLRDPMLPARYLRRLRGEAALSAEEEKRQRHAFHAALLQGYRESFLYENATLCRMKEVWDYLGLAFPEQERAVRELKKSKTLGEYEVRAEQLLTL